jgi:hypothetical protein
MSDIVPVFSLAYTSVRPNLVPQVIALWNSRSTLNQHEWCIGVDSGNQEVRAVVEAVARKVPNIKLVLNTGAPTCVAGWNAAASVTKGKVIITVADDFVPPHGWDALLLSLEPKGWENGEHVVKVEDGYVHNIFVLSILTRKRYERYGYVFYPKYLSLFCDTEFGAVATRDGVVIEANHLLFEHCHPDCFKRTRDGADMVHASAERWKSGEMLFLFRQSQDFPVDDGPKAKDYAVEQEQKKLSTPITSERYVAYMQVTKDDLCLLDVCHRLVEEGVHDFCFCQPNQYWSGEKVAPDDLAEVGDIMDTLKKDGQTVHRQIFNVDSYRMPGDTRILVETRVRNASLEWIRALGYKHILVVDGDELWMRGTLSIIKPMVEQGNKAISVHMVPVIGVPGYPVELATDVAVVYVGPDVIFKVCRSPYIPQTIVYRPLIYHFTGTRKGMEETINKHRRGGHYDDPDYDFEGWLKDKLPNIKPGMTDAHMYKPRQIWPRVRAWRPDELAQMPPVVLQFLGTEGLAEKSSS